MMNTEQLTTDDYFRLGVSLVVLQLHGRQYPARHRATARLTLLSTWTSCSDRDGITERGALSTALPHLTSASRVRAALLATPPANSGRVAGLRFLLAAMAGGHVMRSTARQRSDQQAVTALAMADGLLEALPELIDPDKLEVWASATADRERENGAWVIDLLEAGHDPYDDLLVEAQQQLVPGDEGDTDWWPALHWRLG